MDRNALIKMAEDGNKEAMYYLSTPEITPDANEAFKWTEKSANNGNSESQWMLAQVYFDESGTAYDFEKGLYWCDLAAKRGSTEAQFYLGSLYKEGRGVDEDEALALRWIAAAAAGGHPGAAPIAGVLYAAAGDFAKAERWTKIAAEAGDAEAQSTLAAMTEKKRAADMVLRKGQIIIICLSALLVIAAAVNVFIVFEQMWSASQLFLPITLLVAKIIISLAFFYGIWWTKFALLAISVYTLYSNIFNFVAFGLAGREAFDIAFVIGLIVLNLVFVYFIFFNRLVKGYLKHQGAIFEIR